MAYNLVLNSSNLIGSQNNSYKYNFINGSLNIPEGSEIAVSQITIPYSWFNISSQIGNNLISYYIPNSSNIQTKYDLIIPNGFYTINDLNIFLQSQLKLNGHYWYSTQGNYSTQIQFVGSITGTTLQVSQTSSQQVQLYIGYVISYIPVGSSSYTTAIISSYTTSAGLYNLSGSPTSTTSVAMISQTNSEILPTIIYPLTIQTYTPQYCNQIISITIPTISNIVNLLGANYVNSNGLNGTVSWSGGYPTSGNQCAYLVIPTTNINTTTIGNLLGFVSGSYPSLNSSIPSTTLTQTINGNSLQSNPPFPSLGSFVNGVIVRCNLVENNVSMPSDVLDNFPITSTFGSNINYLPISNNAMKLIAGKHSSLIITFNDQNFNPLLMNDSNVLISLMIYYPKKK